MMEERGMMLVQKEKEKERKKKELWICQDCRDYNGLLDDGNTEPCRRFDTPLPKGTLYCRHYTGSKLRKLRFWWARKRK
jgi:hypothetical protein